MGILTPSVNIDKSFKGSVSGEAKGIEIDKKEMGVKIENTRGLRRIVDGSEQFINLKELTPGLDPRTSRHCSTDAVGSGNQGKQINKKG